MKHLRKYNESNLNELDKEYLDECFIDFIDDGAVVECAVGDMGRYYDIFINLPGIKYVDGKLINNNGETLSEKIEYTKNLTDFYENIESCIEKVKIKYKNVEYEFSVESEYISSTSIEGKVETEIEAYVGITFSPLKNIIKKPIGTGKLGTIKFSELNDTWDVRNETE